MNIVKMPITLAQFNVMGIFTIIGNLLRLMK